MNMGSTKGKAIMYKSGVNHDALLSPFQEVAQIAEMSVAASHSVTGTVLVQYKYLARTEPALKIQVTSVSNMVLHPLHRT